MCQSYSHNIKKYSGKTGIWETLIYVLLFILPFMNIKIGITYVSRYVIIIITICMLFWYGFHIPKYYDFKFIILYCLIILIPVVIHSDFNYAIFLFTDTIFPICIGYSLILRSHNENLIIKIFVMSGSILAILGIFEAFTGINLIDKIYGLETIRFAANDYRMGIARTYTSFSTSIAFCIYLVMLQILCLYMILSKENKKYWKVYILLFFASILTISRGPIFFNIIVQTYIFLKLRVFKKRQYFYILCAGIIIGVFIVLNTDIVKIVVVSIGIIVNKDKYRTMAGIYGVGDATQRLGLFKWVYEAVKENIIWGNGHNSIFGVKINKWGDIKTSIENYYLAMFHGYGIWGIVATIVFFISLLCKFRPNKIFGKDCSKKEDFCFYVFAICLFFFLTIWTTSFDAEGRFFFLIVGMALAKRADNYKAIKFYHYLFCQSKAVRRLK